MNDLVIYGVGGLGRELMEMVEEINKVKEEWNILGFVDDKLEKGAAVCGYPVLGGFEFFRSHAWKTGVVLGFADCAAKETVYNKIKRLCPNFYFPNIIHPSSYISPRSTLEEGVVVARLCYVNVNSRIGRCVFLSESSCSSHDVVIGDFCSIMPTVRILGSVTIGAKTYIGALAAIKQGLNIGSDVTIGMGSVVIRDVPDGCTVAGNPAKTIRQADKTK